MNQNKARLKIVLKKLQKNIDELNSILEVSESNPIYLSVSNKEIKVYYLDKGIIEYDSKCNFIQQSEGKYFYSYTDSYGQKYIIHGSFYINSRPDKETIFETLLQELYSTYFVFLQYLFEHSVPEINF